MNFNVLLLGGELIKKQNMFIVENTGGKKTPESRKAERKAKLQRQSPLPFSTPGFCFNKKNN